MSEFQPVLNSLLGAAIVGLVTWVWALWKAHNALQLKVAEEYVKEPAMRAAVVSAVEPLKTAIAEQGKSLAHQGRMIEEIARKLHVPAVADD